MAGDAGSSVLPITHGCIPPFMVSLPKNLVLCLVTSSQREGPLRRAGNRYLCSSWVFFLIAPTVCWSLAS